MNSNKIVRGVTSRNHGSKISGPVCSKSGVKITQGYWEIWTQMGELKKQIQFNSLCKQFDEKNREKYPKERFS